MVTLGFYCNGLEAGKISSSDAVGEYLKCVHGCKTNVENVQARCRWLDDAARAEAVEKLLKLEPDIQFKEWRRYEQWEAWLRAQETIMPRQDVCVFVGPSKMGKTEFVLAQLGRKTLHVNCHLVESPDLRKFAGQHVHENLLLDEAGPKLFAKHRDLLQASKRDMTLGHSGTNMYTYTVNMYRVRIVITSNEWESELEEMPKK